MIVRNMLVFTAMALCSALALAQSKKSDNGAPNECKEIAEACTGKRGEDLRKCYRAEAEKRGLKREHGEHHHKRG